VTEISVPLRHHFHDLEQQREASTIGMWVFLVTEIMFFGGLFTGFFLYVVSYPEGFGVGSKLTDLTLGSINTAVLIASSFTMAMGVRNAQLGNRNRVLLFLGTTMVLGLLFLGIKGLEYTHKFEDHLVPGPSFGYTGLHAAAVQLFLSFYFVMTGLHALHMVVGVGLVTYVMIQAWQGKYSTEYYTPVEILGLYWHFVDIVWIFLFPTLYLVARHA
jgi:cytochrome c oxidase subunit 3